MIIKELEIKQVPIVEVKATELETNGINIYNTRNHSVHTSQGTLKNLIKVLRLSKTNAKEIRVIIPKLTGIISILQHS